MKIGFIGLGVMGHGMAKNLLQNGFHVTVYDRSKEAVGSLLPFGAQLAASPRQLAQVSDVVITMLPTVAAEEEVIFGEHGVLVGASPGTVLIEMSTVPPQIPRRAAKSGAVCGIEVLDAPVSGGTARAENGTLTIMVGGAEETFRRCLALLHTLGDKVYHAGEIGSGASMKIVNNLMLGINMVGVAEALHLAKSLGLKPQAVFEIAQMSSGESYALKAKVPRAIQKHHSGKTKAEPGSPIDLQHKDLAIACQIGHSNGLNMDLTSFVLSIYELAQKMGAGREDISAMIELWPQLSLGNTAKA